MTTIKVPGRDDVSAASADLFDQIKKRLGKVPNLYATFGYSEHALKGFLAFEESLNQGVFNAKEREAIALVISETNSCNYCLAAHTLAAMKRGFTKEETRSIRNAESSDPKLHAILQLARSIVNSNGNPEYELLDGFFDQGFNENALVELIGLITVRIFTNYVYAMTDIPIDFPMAEPLASDL